jgi:hypothetical protein
MKPDRQAAGAGQRGLRWPCTQSKFEFVSNTRSISMISTPVTPIPSSSSSSSSSSFSAAGKGVAHATGNEVAVAALRAASRSSTSGGGSKALSAIQDPSLLKHVPFVPSAKFALQGLAASHSTVSFYNDFAGYQRLKLELSAIEACHAGTRGLYLISISLFLSLSPYFSLTFSLFPYLC